MNIVIIQLFAASGNYFNPLSANPTKWSNTLKQFVGKMQTICLSVLTFCEVPVQRVKLRDGKILSILKLL